jgi:hypothetical protein
MRLIRAAALCIPAIRRLRDDRDALRVERDSILLRTSTTPREDRAAAESRIARAEGRLIITEYPYYPKSRPIEAASGGRRIRTRFESEEDRYAETLNGIARHIEALLRIPRHQEFPDEPFWANDWFPPPGWCLPLWTDRGTSAGTIYRSWLRHLYPFRASGHSGPGLADQGCLNRPMPAYRHRYALRRGDTLSDGGRAT